MNSLHVHTERRVSKMFGEIFCERLKICEIKDFRDSSSHFPVIPAQLRRCVVLAETCPVQWATLHPTFRPVF